MKRERELPPPLEYVRLLMKERGISKPEERQRGELSTIWSNLITLNQKAEEARETAGRLACELGRNIKLQRKLEKEIASITRKLKGVA